MRLIPLALASAAAVTLVSCSGGTSDPSSSDAAAPRLTAQLDEAAQQARFQACNKRLDHYRQIKVWMHGGAKPGVARAAWYQLTDAKKSEIFDIAGCIASGGQVSESMITVAQEGNGPEIETRRVANDRDFVVENRAAD